MRNIDKLKTYLKTTANEIRTSRFEHKDSQRGKGKEPSWKTQIRLNKLRYEYRHHHIAYCELRGRTRDQIEQKVRDHNHPNERYISEIKDEYAWSPEEIAAYEERRAKRNEAKEALHS